MYKKTVILSPLVYLIILEKMIEKLHRNHRGEGTENTDTIRKLTILILHLEATIFKIR